MNDLDRLVEQGISEQIFPGAAYAIVAPGLSVIRPLGSFTYDPASQRVDRESLFDLASLTKAVCTTNLIVAFQKQQLLRLEDTVGDYFVEFANGDKRDVNLLHLLSHRSGLPAHRAYWQMISEPEAIRKAILQESLITVPGRKTLYSDIGFMILGFVLEAIAGKSLGEIWNSSALASNMPNARFNPASEHCVPTEVRNGSVTCGIVHDENAKALGGDAGHAGLFATIEDVASFGQWLIYNEDLMSMGRPVDGHTLRAIGWDTNADGNAWWVGNSGCRRVFGHTGFTGTVVWCDPTIPMFVALLTNRVHPTRENQKHRAFFPKFFAAACESLTS